MDFTADQYRRPENQPLRDAVSARKDDLEDLLNTHPAIAQQTVALQAAGFDWRQIVAVLGPFLGQLLTQLLANASQPKPEPTPAPTPVPSPAPGPTPAPVPAPQGGPKLNHWIVGGKARITGLTEGGPNGKRWVGADLMAVLSGKGNAPHDSRFEFDCTVMFDDGHLAEGRAEGEQPDPYWIGQPLAPYRQGVDTEPPMQPGRIRWDWDGAGTVDLSREYANLGNNPRLRIKVPGDQGGLLSNLRFEFTGAHGAVVSIPVEGVDEIHVGRGA